MKRGHVGTWSQEVRTATYMYLHVGACLLVCVLVASTDVHGVHGGFARLHRSLWGVQGGLQQFRQLSLFPTSSRLEAAEGPIGRRRISPPSGVTTY